MNNNKKEQKIKITKNGPYIVSGSVPLSEKIIITNGKVNEYHQGREFAITEEYALCRCGHSKNPPYCDGSHIKVDFDGTETASKEAYDTRASLQEGPDLNLMDDKRCAYARFCHGEDGDVWALTDRSDDQKLKKEAIKAACNCPAGRLVVLYKDGKKIEPEFTPSIEILQDMPHAVSGPIFVKGYIQIESADGTLYEARNRLALCRCGASCNKPFCDSLHVSVKYRDTKQ